MPDDRIAALEPLIGTWDTTITMLQPDGGGGAVFSAVDCYRRSANGNFVEHDVDALMDGGRQQSMEVIAADPAGVGYITHSYDPDGTVSVFTAALEGRNWQITGDIQRFAGTLSADGRELAGQWDQQADGRWSPLMNVVLRKR